MNGKALPFLAYGFILALIVSVSLGIILPIEKLDEQDDQSTTTPIETTIESTQTTTISQRPTPTPPSDQVFVSPFNFVRAETDRCMELIRKKIRGAEGHNGINVWGHLPDKGDGGIKIVRPNYDTIYSAAILDPSKGKITIELPSTDRYMSIYCFDQDQYAIHYDTAPTIFTVRRESMKTEYAACLIRTALLENTPEDLEKVHAIQRQAKLYVDDTSLSTFDTPYYNKASANDTRVWLRKLTLHVRDTDKMFGSRYETDDIQHLIGVAAGWGGLPREMVLYVGDQVDQPDGLVDYEIVIKDVPVDAFWSIAVYDLDGFIFDDAEHFSINSYVAKPNADGSHTIRFTNSEGENTLNIGYGWNYLIRFYEPKQQLLSGEWEIPEPYPILK